MDRSFLSHAGVVTASREFVCIRPSTYESAKEAPFLESLFRGRSGNLENTIFAILAPDGRTRLCRTGRSPSFAYDSPDDMARAMQQILRKYPGTAPANATLPLLPDVRLAINVAACDSTPLAILYAPDPTTRPALEQKLIGLAWHKNLVGRMQYCVATKPEELKSLAATGVRPGLLVVQPGAYGTSGQVVTSRLLGSSSGDLQDALQLGILLSEFQQKVMRTHVARGRQLGINWKTAIPVTDPGGRRRRRP